MVSWAAQPWMHLTSLLADGTRREKPNLVREKQCLGGKNARPLSKLLAAIHAPRLWAHRLQEPYGSSSDTFDIRQGLVFQAAIVWDGRLRADPGIFDRDAGL